MASGGSGATAFRGLATKGGLGGALAVCAIALCGLLAPAGANAATLTHTFDANDQAWVVVGNDPAQQAARFAPTFNAAGGNPGGYISATDAIGEDCVAPTFFCQNLFFYYDEPTNDAWFGPNYGGTLQFDTKVSGPGAIQAVQVEIKSTNGSLAKNFPAATTDWVTHSAVLGPAGGWFWCAENVCEPANQRFHWVDGLGGDPQVLIFVDAIPGIGETYSMDNFKLLNGPDGDGDGSSDGADNCPGISNSDQADHDLDQEGGDACDIDDDNDGIPDATDNCHFASNPGQQNHDPDANGDVCDTDDDNDTVEDATDNCDFAANVGQENNDADTDGDACDADDDNDGVGDATDNCDFTANGGQENNDADTDGDACDADDDNDGVFDANDICPNQAGLPGYNGCAAPGGGGPGGGGTGGPGGGAGGALATGQRAAALKKCKKKKGAKRKKCKKRAKKLPV